MFVHTWYIHTWADLHTFAAQYIITVQTNKRHNNPMSWDTIVGSKSDQGKNGHKMSGIDVRVAGSLSQKFDVLKAK